MERTYLTLVLCPSHHLHCAPPTININFDIVDQSSLIVFHVSFVLHEVTNLITQAIHSYILSAHSTRPQQLNWTGVSAKISLLTDCANRHSLTFSHRLTSPLAPLSIVVGGLSVNCCVYLTCTDMSPVLSML